MRTAETVFQANQTNALLRVYVWDIPVRIFHWLIAGSIAVLAVTGLYIGYPFDIFGQTQQQFMMGYVRGTHFYAATVFVVSVLGRIAWMFLSPVKAARWNRLLPVSRDRISGLFDALRFYLFLQRKPRSWAGHNPLAGAAYAGIFGLYLVMILTGGAIYGASAATGSPMRLLAPLAPLIGGLQVVRWVHHVVTWLLLAFVIHHVYSAILTSIVEGNGELDSIFSGYKTVRPEELAHPEIWVDVRHAKEPA